MDKQSSGGNSNSNSDGHGVGAGAKPLRTSRKRSASMLQFLQGSAPVYCNQKGVGRKEKKRKGQRLIKCKQGISHIP
jgi:hypothetical protein